MVANMADVAVGQASFSSPAKLHTSHSAVSRYMHQQHGISHWPTPGQEDPVLRPPAPVPTRGTAFLHTDPSLTLTPDKLTVGHRKHISTSENLPFSNKTTTMPNTSLHGMNPVDTELYGSKLEPIPARLTSIEPDPLLAVTPDKPVRHVARTKSSLRKEGNSAVGMDKLKHKVRFDIDKHNDSAEHDSSGEKVALKEKSVQDVLQDDETLVENTELCGGLSSDTHHSVCVSQPNNRNINIPRKTLHHVGKGPNLIVPDEDDSIDTGRVIVTREMQEQPVLTEYRYPFHVSSSVQQEEHVFSRPEFHNSLKVYSELKAVGVEEVDVSAALSQYLEHSTTTRQDISEKAASRVNQKYESSVYSDLVGLDPPLQDLCQHTERVLSLRVKPSSHSVKMEKDGPDLMEFYSGEMERQSADFQPLTVGGGGGGGAAGGVGLPPEQLSTAPASLAFNLYRHNRVWDSLPRS